MPLNSSVRENGEIIITSGDRLTIETAAEFSRIIGEAFEASKNIALEFEPVVDIDITGVQIICSACKSAAVGGKTFSNKYCVRQPTSQPTPTISKFNRCMSS